MLEVLDGAWVDVSDIKRMELSAYDNEGVQGWIVSITLGDNTSVILSATVYAKRIDAYRAAKVLQWEIKQGKYA
jgi:hypothetical protein